jgi:hypothetical protein
MLFNFHEITLELAYAAQFIRAPRAFQNWESSQR